MFKKILLTIQILLTSLFSVVSIENNTTTPKPRLINQQRYVDSGVLPNTGYIEKIYIQKYRSTADTIEFLNNTDLDYFINPMAEQTQTRRQDMYIILCNNDISLALCIFRVAYLENGVFVADSYTIQTINFTSMQGEVLFTSNQVTFNGNLLYSGWQMSSPELVVNSNVVSSVPNFNFPVGQQNNSLGQLVSIENRFLDMYSYNYGHTTGVQFGLVEGERNGYTYGYNDGYDEGYTEGKEDGIEQAIGEGYEAGYDEGYDEGYDIGKEDGKNNTNPFGGFFEILESATSSMHNFFSIEILPNLTLSTLLGIFVALPLFVFFMKLISSK